MFRVIVDSETGDKVKVQFPVGAIKKILKATGKLPIPEKDLQGVDLSSMMDAISECLDDEIEGDFVSVEAADGTIVRVFVDKWRYENTDPHQGFSAESVRAGRPGRRGGTRPARPAVREPAGQNAGAV